MPDARSEGDLDEPVGGAAQVELVSAPTSEDAGPRAPGRCSEWLLWLDDTLDSERRAVIAVLVMGCLLFLPFLGTLGLWDPWETHYGEVARAMIARDDYVYPYWESAYFFSKPAFPLWLMAFGMLAVGAEGAPAGEPLGAWTELGVRIPFALIAIWTLFAVYRIGSLLGGRRVGLLSAFVLASCPQFIFIGKQAMTDMPLVGLMTVGLMFFMGAVFDREEDGPASRALRIETSLGLGLALFVQLLLIGRELKSTTGLLAVGGAAAIGGAIILYIMLKASRRDCWLIAFYALAGLAALSKGLAVLAVVGPTVLLYCFFSGDFDLLRRSKFYLWGIVFLLVASPWYVTLSFFKGRDDEGLTFTQRFWFHDNFNRVGSGVHGDRAGMAYYIEQFSYGMFPWAAALPLAIGRAIGVVHDERDQTRARATLFVLVWALWTYAFFTMSQTKFHHYVFPGVPAFAILAGLWFVWVAESPASRMKKATALVILLLLAVVARDLLVDPKNLVNLFTYKYDRPYPRELDPRLHMGLIFGLGALVMIPSYLRRRPAQTLLGFALLAGVFGAWISHHHFNYLSPHWGQAHLFKTYYSEKKAGEPIYAYQLNWRGETFYSRNQVLQVMESGANERIRQLVDQPGREFIITEQSRLSTLRGVLSPDKRDKLQVLDRSNNKFYLCVVED